MSGSRVLVTGGLGYIGSHACIALTEAGYDVSAVDNLVNSSRGVHERLCDLTGKAIVFHELDLRDGTGLAEIFARGKFDAVVHFAGLKAVGESVDKPLLYYASNIGSTVVLLEAMKQHGVKQLVFSSSATVYGQPDQLPLREDHPLRPQNPYGRTKLIIEHLLADYAASDRDFRYVALRYFNPIGAHPSGRIGEEPRGVPNNLLPYVAQVAVGRLPRLRVFGADYATPDGTGVRDYIHVTDLALGHVAALNYLRAKKRSITVNLGTGRGYSVLEVVKAFEAASGRKVPLEMTERRAGDTAASYADPSLAKVELGWTAERDISEMCASAWRWQSSNPNGYAKS